MTPSPIQTFYLITVDSWLEQLQALSTRVRALLDAEADTGTLAIAVPQLTSLIHYQIAQALQGLPCQWLSGTELSYDQPVVRIFVVLLQWLNSEEWQTPVTVLEIRSILRYWKVEDELVFVSGEQLLASETLPQPLLAWRDWRTVNQNLTFEGQLLAVFNTWMAPFANTTQPMTPVTRLLERYDVQRDILKAFDGSHQTWLLQIKQGLVADTPPNPTMIMTDHIVVGTPQKLIDLGVRRDHYIWIDVSSEAWCRTDNAPLYNAWVHSASWQDGLLPSLVPPETPDPDDWLVRVRAGHISRTLMLLVQQSLTCIASEEDSALRANTGRLLQMLPRVPHLQETTDPPSWTLRLDQAPVLNYERGTMAVSAVPGAGKTFVTVALILHLINTRHIPAENILVLTYMDSAVKTLTRRLKPHLGHQLPTVSTIHSLAYRILRTGDHATKLGWLPEAFEILDDVRQEALFNQVAMETLPPATGVESWARTIKTGIARLKDQGGNANDIARFIEQYPDNERMTEFYPAVLRYQERCRQDRLLDFTDLIRLAIALLQQEPTVRAFYQSQYQVIIEDEAQDSSSLLQQLISLLGGNEPNLIRTGDTNQSITTTFSSADPQVFRSFIHTADRVVTMDGSGRCAPEIMDFANQWIRSCQAHPDLSDAFQPVAMKPVADQNPTLLRPIRMAWFGTEAEELTELAMDVGAACEQDADASKAVLVRDNYQVRRLAEYLMSRGLPAVTSLEPSGWRTVTDILFSWIHLLVHPEDAEALTIFLTAYAVVEETAGELLASSDPDGDNHVLPPLSILTLPQVHHPLAQKLYYDWLDFSRDLDNPPRDRWLPRMADHLLPEDLRVVAYHLSPLASQGMAYQPEPVLWLLSRRNELERQLLSVLKRSVDTHADPGVIQVMNLHQSKGQEFDWVWMPAMTTASFPYDQVSLRQKQSMNKLHIQKLELTIARLFSLNKHSLQTLELANNREKLEEEARLIYVGITRARRALWCSGHASSINRYGGKPSPRQPNLLLLDAALATQT